MAPVEDISCDALLPHLLNTYDIKVQLCVGTTEGLDNSVYYVYTNEDDPIPSYVFKLVETRKAIDIFRSLQTSGRLAPQYTALEYVRTRDHHLVSKFQKKAAFLMTFIAGHKLTIDGPAQMLQLARYIGDLHGKTAQRSQVASADSCEAFLETVALYSSEKTLAGVAEHFPVRADFYNRAFALLNEPSTRARLIKHMRDWPGTFGLTHGDLHNDNLIVSHDGNLNLIDFDSTKDYEFQLVDVLQALARWPLTNKLSELKTFIATYLNVMRSYEAAFMSQAEAFQTKKNDIDADATGYGLGITHVLDTSSTSDRIVLDTIHEDHATVSGNGILALPRNRNVRSFLTRNSTFILPGDEVTPPSSIGGEAPSFDDLPSLTRVTSSPQHSPPSTFQTRSPSTATVTHLVQDAEIEACTKSVLHWLSIFALKAMLSIDFYAFDQEKFSAEFLELNAAATFEGLQTCIEECLGHAGLGAGMLDTK